MFQINSIQGDRPEGNFLFQTNVSLPSRGFSLCYCSGGGGVAGEEKWARKGT